MEKKIIIKLFENFKNDLDFAKTRSIEIVNYILTTGVKLENNKMISGDFTIETINFFKDVDTWFKYDVEISFRNNEYVEILNINYDVINRGGELINTATRSNPEEYNDSEFEFEVLKFTYSKIYEENTDEHIEDLELQNNIDDIATKKIIELGDLLINTQF